MKDDLINREAALAAISDDKGIQYPGWWYKDRIRTVPGVQRWIPVSERLPEETDSIWRRFYGTTKWTNGMWRSQSKKVLVTVLFDDGSNHTDTACTHDGEWYVGVATVGCEVIAWMPLPDPWEENHD